MSGYQDGAFRQEIESLSKQSSKNHAYPRPDLINLSNYLSNIAVHRTVADSLDITSAAFEESITDSFALVHDITTGDGTPFSPSPSGLKNFVTHKYPSGSSLLFLRGFASPEWLTAIGEIHSASSELYRQHLEFQAFTSGVRDLYSSPSLPSSSSRVFQLTIPTICTRNVGISGYEPEDMQLARHLESEAMNRYFKQLRNRAKVADSVVRKSQLLSKQEYVLEQAISIEVGPPGDNWRAIVWMDNGKDLSQSVPGPWNPRPGTRAWETYFFPVIVHHDIELAPKAKKKTALNRSTTVNTVSGHTNLSKAAPEEEWRAAQNTCQLPFQYGSSLDRDLASRDALYALSELFHFAASAEVQLLNLLQRHIDHELSFVGLRYVSQSNSVSLLNLKYVKTLLTSRAQGLTEIIGILRNRSLVDWPRADDDVTAEKAGALLLADYEHLLQRAETLARECEQGMATLADSSVLEESKRSVGMAKTVQRLTVIGTVFIPLSFVCSVWGMNFKQLGSGSQSIWLLFASAAPVVLLSYVIYSWDTLAKLYRNVVSKRRSKV